MSIPEYQIQLLELFGESDLCEGDLWWDKPRGDTTERLRFNINCNDRFEWACADGEEVRSQSDVNGLRQALDDARAAGVDRYNDDWPLLWIARKRGMRPQGAAYKYIDEKLWPLFDAAGPERDKGVGNPYAPGEYDPSRFVPITDEAPR